ncbi:MAG: hypothetical protein M3280_02905, partial [Actinomycetota bacterium]|nr:hypothetical protein [Actinomycetota bacterium]
PGDDWIMREQSVKRNALGLIAATGALALLTSAIGSPAAARRTPAPVKGEGQGLKPIAHIPYEGGTDMELARIKGRDYAFAGDSPSYGTDGGAIRVIDVTKPARPRVVASLKCAVDQADIQISHDKRTLIVAADSGGGPDSCGLFGQQGFLTIDISNPTKPKVVGKAVVERGSHNTTAHPTKPLVYNSDADLLKAGEIEIWSIKNSRKPKLVNTVPSLPHSPHDISFNKKGTMAVTAAISHFDLFDTSNPTRPRLVYTGQCPGCSITHDAKFTPDGTGLVIGDEAAGGQPYPCPGGALYFYELPGGNAAPVPVLTGVYEPGVVFSNNPPQRVSCTSHVFDFSEKGNEIAISWYGLGTRHLGIKETIGPTFGDVGVTIEELGWFVPENTDSWSSKFHRGPFIYANDLNLGFIVYQIKK